MNEQGQLYQITNHVVNLKNLNHMRLTGELCDVTIKVNGKEFPAHKVILAANFKYFQTMFSNPFVESNQNIVTMEALEETDLESLITYAYTGQILLTDSNALNLLEAANYLIEDGIQRVCIDFLQKHLKKEQACRAYMLANVMIGCSSLKCMAKQIISSNFEDCSLTTEYLDLNFTELKDILSSASFYLIQSPQVFFEGVVRWILHDGSSRRACINDLLEYIEINKMKTYYLWQYICKGIEDQEHSDVFKDIMSFCYKKSQIPNQMENLKQSLMVTGEMNVLKQSLMVIGEMNDQVCVQLFDSMKRQWDQPRLVLRLDGKLLGQKTILNTSVYYTCNNSSAREYTQVSLQVINPTMKQNTMLSDSRLLSQSTMCASRRFLYLCGGRRKDYYCSNQVLKYDPQTNSFLALTPMRKERSNGAAIFFENCLYILGGLDRSFEIKSVEKYDPKTMRWQVCPSMKNWRYNFAVAVLNGKMYACGGNGTNTAEVYDPSSKKWRLVASMNKWRENFLVLAHEGKLIAVGGDSENTVEVYDPSKDQWQMDYKTSSGLQIVSPGGGFIASIPVSVGN